MTDQDNRMTDQDKLINLLDAMRSFSASDLHLKVNAPPTYRVAGTLRLLKDKPYTKAEIEALVMSVLSEDQQAALRENGNVDFAYEISESNRIRGCAFYQRGVLSLAARLVTAEIPTCEELHLPVLAMERISLLEQGLIIVAGVTGSGKSTTIASCLQMVNHRRRCHIVTIEDPIEYLYTDDKAHINQREVGIDVVNFHEGVRSVLRQDPDVILLGEMRDEETMDAALIAAETGHLVFTTLHSSTVPQTFSRILDLFPGDKHDVIRRSLQFNLQAVICQKLLAGIRKEVPRVPACEVMISNPAIRKMIAEGEEKKIADILKTGEAEGMQDFTKSLVDLIRDGYISQQTGLAVAPNPEALRSNLKGIYFDQGTVS